MNLMERLGQLVLEMGQEHGVSFAAIRAVAVKAATKLVRLMPDPQDRAFLSDDNLAVFAADAWRSAESDSW